MRGGGVISSRCGSSNCIEVAPSVDGRTVYIRDTDPDTRGTYEDIVVSRADWVAFVEGVKRGDFDGI